jgi:hypothetical protein
MVPQVIRFLKLIVKDHQTDKRTIINNIKMVVNAHVVSMQIFLTMRKVVANTNNMVVVSSILTTTHHFVVRKITTGGSIWSLLLLTTEPHY